MGDIADIWGRWAHGQDAEGNRVDNLADAVEIGISKLQRGGALDQLGEHPQLEVVSISGGTVKSLAPLVGLPNLRHLRIYDKARVKDLTHVNEMGLQRLSLGRDYELLSGVSCAIDTVELMSPAVSTLDPLARIPGIRTLVLGGRGGGTGYVAVGDTTAFPELADLECLHMRSRLLTTLRPLAHLKRLRVLDAGRNRKLRDVHGLEQLPLERLAIHQTNVTSLEPLRGVPLEVLLLDESRVRSLEGVDSASLQVLTAYKARLKRLEVAEHPALRVLTFADNKLWDVSDVAGLERLEVLTLSGGTGVGRVLQDKPWLRVLDLAHSDIDDADVLDRLPRLERVNLHETALKHWRKDGVSVQEREPYWFRPVDWTYRYRLIDFDTLLVPGDWRVDVRKCRKLARPHTEHWRELDVLWQIDVGELWGEERSYSGDLVQFVARLPSGRYALRTRHEDQEAWIEGDRDSVLASVPDRFFEDAAYTLHAVGT